jgi:hypothetical protein
MSWYKLYIVEMQNKKYSAPNDGRRMIKFGITHHMDIMKRFDPTIKDGYEKNYEDWKIIPKYSQVFYTLEDAQKAEKYLLHTLFPAKTHKVWVEDYLRCESRDEYYNNTGITEIRLLTDQEIRNTIVALKSTQSDEQRLAKMNRQQNYMNS